MGNIISSGVTSTVLSGVTNSGDRVKSQLLRDSMRKVWEPEGRRRRGNSGALDSSGAASVTVKRGNLDPLAIQLTVSADAESLSGSISDGTWTATITSYRAVFVGTSTPSDQAGRYTMIVPAPGVALYAREESPRAFSTACSTRPMRTKAASGR